MRTILVTRSTREVTWTLYVLVAELTAIPAFCRWSAKRYTPSCPFAPLKSCPTSVGRTAHTNFNHGRREAPAQFFVGSTTAAHQATTNRTAGHPVLSHRHH